MGPLVTLTTDFGLADPWVGIMKGTILGLAPQVRLVDLSHEVAPQDVIGAQLVLAAAVPFFPPGTVHLVVVDPGVGSQRRALAVAAGGQAFVGPDNGCLTPALEGPRWRAVALAHAVHRLYPVSRTFHGRDVFAPAAAHLALGVALEQLGPAVEDPVLCPLPRARREGDRLVGEVLAVDRFGNLITSITEADLEAWGEGASVEVAGREVGPLVAAYAERAPGQPGAILGSLGRLEVFVNQGAASHALGAGRGSPVRLRRPGGS